MFCVSSREPILSCSSGDFNLPRYFSGLACLDDFSFAKGGLHNSIFFMDMFFEGVLYAYSKKQNHLGNFNFPVGSMGGPQ